MSAAQRMLDITANNLANASTTAFKGDGLIFQDAFEASLNSDGRDIGQMSYGVTPGIEFTNRQVGEIQKTGNPLDVAITTPEGAFKVDLGQGQTRFTRDGSFHLNDQKVLVDSAGHPVLDDGDRPITLDGNEIDIDSSGQINVGGQATATLGVFSGTFVKDGQNLYTCNDSKAMENAGVQSRALEGSNVNAIEAMIQMITLSRSFDMAQKAVQQHDELSQRLIQSLNGQ